MAKKRKINIQQFEKQLAENVVGPDSLLEVELGDGESIYLKIPVDTNSASNSAFEAMGEAMKACGDDEEAAALVCLEGHPTMSAREQLDMWLATGRTPGLLLHTWTISSRETMQNLAEFRYRP